MPRICVQRMGRNHSKQVLRLCRLGRGGGPGLLRRAGVSNGVLKILEYYISSLLSSFATPAATVDTAP